MYSSLEKAVENSKCIVVKCWLNGINRFKIHQMIAPCIFILIHFRFDDDMKMKSFLVEGGFLDLDSICNAKLNYTKQLRHKAIRLD